MTSLMQADPSKFNAFMPEWSKGPALCFVVDKPISADGMLFNLAPKIEDTIRRHGEARLMVYFRDFQGWLESGAMLDLEMTSRFGKDLTRIALVNPDEKMVFLFKVKMPLLKGDVRFFAEDTLQDAIDWVNEP